MIARVTMWVGLLTVAGAAAVLSFDPLRTSPSCAGSPPRPRPWCGWAGGYPPRPAGSPAGSRWACWSVAGNALGHGLAAYSARPHWLIVVAVSAVAPTVLGAVGHLAVLATHTADATGPDPAPDGPDASR